MTLGKLLELHVNGVLKIKHDEGEDTAVVGGATRVNIEQAKRLCKEFGWTEIYLSPFEIITKTNSMMKSIRRSPIWTSWDPGFINTINVEFQNRRANTYGKTFDRFVFYAGDTKFVVIHGMEHIGAAYVVYVNGSSTPSCKCRSFSKVAEYMVSVI